MATNGSNGTRATGPRCIALVGPFQSGKTTLLEAILARTGAIQRQGTVEAGNTVGDASKEARHHRMSVELTVATTNFMGDPYTFLDCPGSVEFVHDMRAVLPAIDVAVVVCEMDEKKVPQLQLILRELEDKKIPRILFVNKIDKADAGVHDVLKLLQPASRTKLILRQIPTFAGDLISGFVDLALERAFVYKEHAPSEVVPLEGDAADLEKTARFSMLETLADHDDELMEQLLEDIQPPRDKVFDDLTRELREGLVCPVLMGTATRANGVLRLLKALRHESPGIAETAKRLGVKGRQRSRRLCAENAEHHPRRKNVGCARARRAGRRRHDFPVRRRRSRPRCRRVQARRPDHRKARPGRARRDRRVRQARQGQDRRHAVRRQAGPCRARQGRALSAGARHRDLGQGAQGRREARPGAATSSPRKIPRSPSCTMPRPTRWCCGARAKCICASPPNASSDRFGVAIERRQPSVGYRETIRKGVVQRGRHKKQSGGHGQYGDVVLDIKPMPRSAGFSFEDKITGGVVPRNYIPSVEEGVVDALKHGPLGFPVVDLHVALVDGSYHTVDSSDMAFRIAGRIGIVEALPQCQPVLLEPIHLVEIVCPSEATAKINALMSGRRGQILGFDTREGWEGWDVVRAKMPEAEIGDLIVEVRSATAGAGTFTFKFDHMAELTGRTADQIVAARRAAE